MSYPSENAMVQYIVTSAELPNPAFVTTGTIILISDYGINGSLWRSNGSAWVPVSFPIKLDGLDTGILLPSLSAANLATYSQVGTTITVDNTLAHNIPATTFDGDSVYLVPFTGSLIEGVFTNFTRTGANTFTCESTISQTISGNLASTTGIKTLKSLTIPGGILGLTGRFETQVQTQYFNSANNKTLSLRFGGSNYYSFSNTTTGRNAIIAGMRNRNSQSIQQATSIDTTTGLSTTTGGIGTTAIDTTTDKIIELRATVAASNEYMCIEHCSLLVYPSSLV